MVRNTLCGYQTGGTPEGTAKYGKVRLVRTAAVAVLIFLWRQQRLPRTSIFSTALFFETDNIVRCASDDVTQLLHCEQCNVFVLLQRIKRFIVDPVLQKIILRDIPLPHRFPKRAEINQTVHHLFPRFSM